VDKRERNSLLAVPIVLIVAALVALAGSDGGVIVFGLPLFVICVALAFVIQWVVFIHAFINQTEKFFDLTGSITYLTVIAVAILFSPARDTRIYLLGALVAVWALRLGTFLFSRIRAEGEDRRFRDLKPSFPRFLMTWTLQGLWVSLTLAAALAAITSTVRVDLGVIGLVGFLVWLVGFAIEVIADRQKSQFRADPNNAGKYIQSGLWSWSRHPNYFGEIVLWVGVAIITIPVLQGWQWLTMISPLFVILLLTRVSGVPMLEARADERWGGQPDYEAYKARTSELILRPPSA
jgi:steroid 5-alpha reductase family enzyme